MNYQAYLSQVRERLLALGFAEMTIPADLAGRLGFALEREEAWGRLMIALPPALAPLDPAPREALARAAGAWVRNLQRRETERRYLILVYPFERRVSDEMSEAVKALREEGADQRWGLVAWPADLEVELIDRPPGFPKVEDKVARAITEVPRGGLFQSVSAPRVARRPVLGDLSYVPATRIILAATVAYYLWVLLISGSGMMFLQGPGVRTLLTWGANNGQLVIEGGQHWRLLTHVLLHGGLLHLGLNMWALWSLGRHAELVYGTGRMVYIYTFAGVAGGLASTVLRPYSITGVGASGAILGLMGAMVYFALSMRGRVDWRALMGPIMINLFAGFLIAGIDNYAHFGGFFGGLLAAFIVGVPGQRSPWRAAAMIAGGVVIGVVLSGLVPLPRLF